MKYNIGDTVMVLPVDKDGNVYMVTENYTNNIND